MNAAAVRLEAMLRDAGRRLRVAHVKAGDPHAGMLSRQYAIEQVQDALEAALHQMERM